MKISIIIPIYNSEKYLAQTLDSVINQTYKNLEIICVNDGSKDSSLEILNKYREKDPRIIIINKENGGVSSARNTGVKKSTGKYVEFLDSDDLIVPQTCENLYREAQKYDADIVRFGYCGFKDGETPNIAKTINFHISKSKYYFHSEMENPFLENQDFDVIHNKFWKKKFLNDINLIFDEKIHLGEDSLFCWMAFIRNSRVVVDNNIYHYYRKGNTTSLMNSSNKKWFDNRLKMIKYLIEHKQSFKFQGSDEWMLSWAMIYIKDHFYNLETREEKSEYSKKIFRIIEEPLLKNKNLNVCKEDLIFLNGVYSFR